MSDETTTGIDNRKLLMWVFLGSDCMFFASLIGTYLIYKGTGNLDIGPVDVFDIPIVTLGPDTSFCYGESITLNPTGDPAYAWSWNNPNGLSCTNCVSPVASPSGTTAESGVTSRAVDNRSDAAILWQGPCHLSQQ